SARDREAASGGGHPVDPRGDPRQPAGAGARGAGHRPARARRVDGLRDRYPTGLRGGTVSGGNSVLRSFLSAPRVVIKEDRLFAVSALDGSMRTQSADGHGLWLGDTRFLSEYHVLVEGDEPQLKDLHIEGGF